MITISVCMIVKNEEQVLGRCLDSLTSIADEIVIVDTGSTDRTKEIAKQYTDKIYDFKWVDDFAKARNFSFEKATKDYIYVADADEVIDKENQKRFQLLKEAMLPEIDIVQMMYCNQLEFGTTYNFDEEYRPKLYKRVRTFYWHDPIHESVMLEPVVFNSEIRIEHRPLSVHGTRDFAIFQKLIERGEELSDKLHTMYAKELFIVGEKEDVLNAVPFFEDTMRNGTRSYDAVLEAICVLARAYRLQDNLYELFKVGLKGIADNPSSEVCYEIGEYFYQKEDFSEASLWFYNAAFETKSILNVKYEKVYPIERLQVCYEKMGKVEEAKKYQAMLS